MPQGLFLRHQTVSNRLINILLAQSQAIYDADFMYFSSVTSLRQGKLDRSFWPVSRAMPASRHHPRSRHRSGLHCARPAEGVVETKE
ncbi:hypothetical protein C9413_02355 [Rhizobium sp. SEMIA 4085]|uniref:hypothetical protein n=1 Tax=Rhizobium TaxID=379 RepID=UPI001478BC18|nr:MULTISPECIES: hypothetical protein [Rhizobium]NNH28386.1 hypothetical protein [Rhizobium sp. SEMIA 4085]